MYNLDRATDLYMKAITQYHFDVEGNFVGVTFQRVGDVEEKFVPSGIPIA